MKLPLIKSTLTLSLLLAANTSLAFDCGDLVGQLAPPNGADSAAVVSSVLQTSDPNNSANQIPHCLVSGTIDVDQTQPSIINFRMRLPLPGTENGRLWMGGDGGLAGNEADETMLTLFYNSQVTPLSHGFTTATNDTGHIGGLSAAWALDTPPSPGFDNEGELNFAHVAVHMTAVVAKNVMNLAYGADPSYSYFNGCSTGGRQALVAMSLYPEDFDGIIAGAPLTTQNGTLNLLNFIKIQGDHFGELTEAKMDIVTNTVLALCDLNDGVADGIVNDPTNPQACNFKPTRDLVSHLCPNDIDDVNCFTTTQLEILDDFYKDVTLENILDENGNPIRKTVLYGLLPSSEAGNGFTNSFSLGWSSWFFVDPIFVLITGGRYDNYTQLLFAEYLQYFLYDQPDNNLFNIHDYVANTTLEQMLRDSNKMSQGYMLPIETINTQPFSSRGGKLMIVQGANDMVIPPKATIDYFNQLKVDAGSKNARDDFARLYFVPGIGHCGNSGPSVINYISVIQDWVENGVQPNEIVATDVSNSYSRKLCPYPLRMRVIDPNGDVNSADNFECVISNN